MRRFAWILILVAACGGASPLEQLKAGSWESEAGRSLRVGDGKLTWQIGSKATEFGYDVTAESGRTVDLKIRGPGGVTYHFELAEDGQTATMTEQTERRTVHALKRSGSS